MTILRYLLILFVGIFGASASTSTNHDIPPQTYKLYVPRQSAAEFVQGNYFYNYQYCQAIGMQALTPNTPDKLAYLAEFMKENGLDIIWTSGNCLAEDRKFVWWVNSRPLDFADWHVGEPSGDGQCLDIWDHNWAWKMSDGNCNIKRAIVCEEIIEH